MLCLQTQFNFKHISVSGGSFAQVLAHMLWRSREEEDLVSASKSLQSSRGGKYANYSKGKVIEWNCWAPMLEVKPTEKNKAQF